MMRCQDCDFSFDAKTHADVKAHELRHRQMALAEEHHGQPIMWVDQEGRKSRGWGKALDTTLSIEERLSGLEEVSFSHWSRSVSACLRTPNKHPSLEAYRRAQVNNAYPSDLVEAWRARHPYEPKPWLASGYSHVDLTKLKG